MAASIASIESRAENREVWLDCALGAWWIAAGSADIRRRRNVRLRFIFRASTGEQMFATHREQPHPGARATGRDSRTGRQQAAAVVNSKPD
jgi:hypothetical protein